MAGFSSDPASSLLLACFWGAAAVHRSRPWISRVASADNPADCQTKDGLPRDHLHGASWESGDVQPLWDLLQSCLREEVFPKWSTLVDLYSHTFQ